MSDAAVLPTIDDQAVLEIIGQGKTLAEHQGLPEELYKLQIIAAQNAVAEKDYNAAARLSMMAAALDHKKPEAWALLGNVQKALGAHVQALQAWGMAFQLNADPRIGMAMVQLAHAVGLRDGLDDMITGLRIVAADDSEVQSTLDAIESSLKNEG